MLRAASFYIPVVTDDETGDEAIVEKVCQLCSYVLPNATAFHIRLTFVEWNKWTALLYSALLLSTTTPSV